MKTRRDESKENCLNEPMSHSSLSHGYTKAAFKELLRLPAKARQDICTIVPILTRDMVVEACQDCGKISERAKILREAGVTEIAHNLYKLNTDKTHSIICKFAKEKCAILSIHQKDAIT